MIELVLIIVILAVLIFVFIPNLATAKSRARQKQCENNLKQISLAFKVWSMDSSDTYPMRTATIRGGSMEWATNGEIFRTFEVTSNEIYTPKILACPADNRTPANSFSHGFGNSNVSYFVNLEAEDIISPQLLLVGDRHLTNGPLTPQGLLLMTSNSTPGWSYEMHKLVGNVALADGSVQHYDIPQLRFVVTNIYNPGTNRLAFP